MRTLKKLFTAEELIRLPSGERRLELVEGQLYEMPLEGGRHGNVAANIGSRLGIHIEETGAGLTFAGGTGFILQRAPDTVRAPDCAFVSKTRLPLVELTDDYLEMAPDLVVEVVSSDDSRHEISDRVNDWLRSGTRLVWVIMADARSVTVYRSLDNVSELSEDDTLDGEDVVPGFACQLRELFS